MVTGIIIVPGVDKPDRQIGVPMTEKIDAGGQRVMLLRRDQPGE